VLYDEPTTGLDASAARVVDGLIRQAAGRGTTSLVVSHDLASLKRVADRVVLLDEGVIAFEGSAAEFFRMKTQHPAVRRFFGGPGD
ncbi:MAG: ABC transporter ATP-binding protein, partial [Myxococcales bacterium]